MNVTVGRSARFIATRLVIATATTATVCVYCAALRMPTPQPTAAEILNTATIVNASSTIGIADSDLYGESQADIDTTLDNLQSIGVQDVRILVPWALVEPSSGVYNWSYVDEVVDAAAARNMGVLADVTSTPTWDAPAGTVAGAGTPNPTDYASFLTQVAKRYGNDISSYEIWNEPNSIASYDPIDPATYTALLKAAYPAIKAVSPNATVIAGGVGAGVTYGNLTLNPVTFVQEMLADGAGAYFDDLSFHPYQETLELSQGGSVPNSPINQLNAIEQLLVADGLSSDKVWITEYGLPTSDVSQQTQATYIQNLIDTWQTVSYAGPVFIYTAQDGTSTDPTGTFGIYTSNWTPKLAVAVIQQEITKLAATNPAAAFAQQIAAAYALFVQQLENAIAQAIANAFAALGTTQPAATPAVTTGAKSLMAAAVVTTASVAAPATPTTPASTALSTTTAAATAPATPVPPTPAVATAVIATPVTPTPAVATPVPPTPAVATPVTATPVTATPVTPTPAVPTPVTATPAAATPVTATPAPATPNSPTPATTASAVSPSSAKGGADASSSDPASPDTARPGRPGRATTTHPDSAHRGDPSATRLGKVDGTKTPPPTT